MQRIRLPTTTASGPASKSAGRWSLTAAGASATPPVCSISTATSASPRSSPYSPPPQQQRITLNEVIKNDFFTPHHLPLQSKYDHNCNNSEDQSSGNGQKKKNSSSGLSEHEYQVRIGRAVQLLRTTLPDFMSIGLADYPNQQASTSQLQSIPLLDPLSLVRIAAPTLRRRQRTNTVGAEGKTGDDAMGSIYHSDVLFEFMPSLTSTTAEEDGSSSFSSTASSSSTSRTDAPNSSAQSTSSDVTAATTSSGLQDELDGKPSFSFSGRTLYLASAHVLRHALNAIFTETHVSLDRLRLLRSGGHSPEGGSGIHSTSSHRRMGDEEDMSESSLRGSSSPTASSADELIARLTFSGITRVTHQPHEYTVLFRYTLDRGTGQIARHRVERIQPEVGRSLWTGLSLAWFRLAPHMYPGSVVHSTIPVQSSQPSPLSRASAAASARRSANQQ
ncbi:hypothetical protein A4X09_0g6831 [Tilletia walkeri]|uniref:Uncharacterized protein n=1 Tax=Tilletia walkeri TaxID=117179 RepID=A0A8X7N1W2_9BASI|nr:hypothetical protein A4X09_0g6831 [Tilletia walkeri]